MSGYVRIHRTLIGHPVFRNDAEAMVFAWLITQAQWKRTRVRYRDHIIQLDRGQLAISLRDLAHRFDRDKAWVSRLLRRLQNEAMIETRTETGVNVITLCNYDEYQADPVLCETPRETPSETGARQGRDTEQVREEGKKETTPRKRGAELPDWMPKEEYLAFRKMRKAMKVPYTSEAEAGIIADCNTLRGEGHDVKLVLLKAVKRGWRGVFGDEDTKAKVPKLDPSTVDWAERAAFLDRIGKPDEARECRRRATPVGKIAIDILNEARVGERHG